jgi:hypothetical protein
MLTYKYLFLPGRISLKIAFLNISLSDIQLMKAWVNRFTTEPINIQPLCFPFSSTQQPSFLIHTTKELVNNSTNPMDPKFKGEWSASEIMMMKSLVSWLNTSSSNMNNKHAKIVDELQAWFPWKEKRQISDLYANLMVEMMRTKNQCAATSSNQQTHNFAMSVEDPAIDNINVLRSYDTEEMGDMSQAKEVPQKQPAPRKEKQFWTPDEHRLFISYISLNPLSHARNF